MTVTTSPTELGDLASGSLADILVKAVGGSSVSSYAESSSPMSWSALADGGWDQIGIAGAEGAASLRDLAEVGHVWGRYCLQLPLLTSILCKRHSSAARETAGPVTFAVPSSTADDGTYFVPYGQQDGVALATGLGVASSVVTMPDGRADEFDLLAQARIVSVSTALSDEAAREIAAVLAAEAAGAAERMLDDSIAFAKEREQFGRPIGSFQAVKHHLADGLISAEQARTAVIWASLSPCETMRACLFAIDQSIRVGELALQVHGGIGFTWELGLHYYLRRILTAREVVSGLAIRHG
jgi:alkylation response protein AidB-like acyl-CoA dehydrogenase